MNRYITHAILLPECHGKINCYPRIELTPRINHVFAFLTNEYMNITIAKNRQ